MNGFIYKSDYIKVRKAHIALCDEYEKILEIIKDNLPEEGKRFDSRSCKSLEAKAKEQGLEAGLHLSDLNKRKHLCITILKKASDTYYNTFTIAGGDYTHYFDRGLLIERDGFLKALDKDIQKIKAERERNEQSIELVDSYMEAYKEYYKAYQELRKVSDNMVGVYTNYVDKDGSIVEDIKGLEIRFSAEGDKIVFSNR